MTLPQRQPDWLRQQLAQLEQRQQIIRDHISAMQSEKAGRLLNGTSAPAYLLRAIATSEDDLTETQEQIKVLNTGWNALHPKP